jgi:predicted nucleic acid-binding protein
MSGNKLFVDTNIFLYLLDGDDTVADVLSGNQVYISFITELELLSFHKLSSSEEVRIKQLINDVTVIDINNEIKQNAIEIRQEYQIKLPDAIILASAKFLDIALFTADKQLNKVKNINLILYEK